MSSLKQTTANTCLQSQQTSAKRVLVIGMGMAGLMAAYTAAKEGHKVVLLATGAGSLSIGSGCVDVLGYVRDTQSGHMHAVQGSPFAYLAKLGPQHPYSIVGEAGIRRALALLQEVCAMQGHDLQVNAQEHNVLIPTIMGTLKPTYMCAATNYAASLRTAKKILIVGVETLRDCFPKLIAEQLSKYAMFKDVVFTTAMLPAPLGNTYRALSPLDVARHVDRPQGKQWLMQHLFLLAKGMDAVLIPPICGAKPSLQNTSASFLAQVQHVIGCPLIEMACLPPGVGGIRIHTVLMRALRQLGVQIIENAKVVQGHVENGFCVALSAQSEVGVSTHKADSVILATGGVLGAGIETSPGKAWESIFQIPIDVPNDPEAWAGDTVFGQHAFAIMGVKVNARLLPVDAQGNEILHNVHVAGRTLAGYDMPLEKCGNGVALSTGWHAAMSL